MDGATSPVFLMEKDMPKKKMAKAKKHEKKHAKKHKKEEKVMHEYKEGKLHSGSKKGPVVSSRRQAVAIALSEARKAGEHVKAKKKSKKK